jgi:hypothetical protein
VAVEIDGLHRGLGFRRIQASQGDRVRAMTVPLERLDQRHVPPAAMACAGNEHERRHMRPFRWMDRAARAARTAGCPPAAHRLPVVRPRTLVRTPCPDAPRSCAVSALDATPTTGHVSAPRRSNRYNARNVIFRARSPVIPNTDRASATHPDTDIVRHPDLDRRSGQPERNNEQARRPCGRRLQDGPGAVLVADGEPVEGPGPGELGLLVGGQRVGGHGGQRMPAGQHRLWAGQVQVFASAGER